MSIPASSFPAPLTDATDALSGSASHDAPRARTLGRPAQQQHQAAAAAAVQLTKHDASLDGIATGGHACVVSIELEHDQAAWLAAVGIREGERLTVLRRAAFGGPMHVRTRAGGEFAIARSLARAILVRVAAKP